MSKKKSLEIPCPVSLRFGTYNMMFGLLELCKTHTLKDYKSEKHSFVPIRATIGTINYFNRIENLKEIVNPPTEKHAFIVSPGRQKIPNGVETKERQLWQALIHPSYLPKNTRPRITDLVHYVKVTSSERYSNKNGHIICSSKSPVELPFKPT